MSSNSSRNGKVPAAISASMVARPPWIACASAGEITPVAASMAACAREPARSSAASRRSKPMETLIACISAPGLAEKRPPHSKWPWPSVVLEGMEDAMVRLRDAGRSFALIGALAALYVIPACSSKADLKSLASGEMKAMKVVDTPTLAPDIAFTDAAGKSHTLAEYKGKVVLVNLWATWCGPCVAEMPTLAKLAAADAGKPVVVLPISVDRPEDRANAIAFIAKRAPLGFYHEPSYALAFGFRPPVADLPTTVLIDPQGRVRAELAGGADWSSGQAQKVIDALAAGG